MCDRLYINTTPFYIRDLSVIGFWYLRGVLDTRISRVDCVCIVVDYQKNPSKQVLSKLHHVENLLHSE
jgi:hypothetical protein